MNADNVLLVSALNILLSIGIFVFNIHRNKNVIYLSLFLILFSVYNITLSLFFFGGNVGLLAVLLNNFAPLQYLSPVFFYFYIRGCVTANPRLRKYDWLHFLPFLINFIAVIPYLFTSWSYKYSIAQRVMSNIEAYMNYDFMLFYPHQINQFARPLQLLVYFVASMVLLVNAARNFRKPGLLLQTRLRSSLVATGIMLVFLVIHFILQFFILKVLAEAVNYNEAMDEKNIILHAVTYLYLIVPLFIIFNPSILYGIGVADLKSQYATETISQKKKSNSDSATQSKTENGNMKLLTERINTYLHEEKPYLHPDFSVHDICVKLNAPHHQVQHCINEVMNTKFTELKNELRVKYAIELFASDKFRNVSIEGIGKNAGFASSSAFHAAFKKVTNLTPNAWLQKNTGIAEST